MRDKSEFCDHGIAFSDHCEKCDKCEKCGEELHFSPDGGDDFCPDCDIEG